VSAASPKTGRATDDVLDSFGPLSGPFPRELVPAFAALTQPPTPAYGPSFAKQAIIWLLRQVRSWTPPSGSSARPRYAEA
jgi:hypothetical protein